MASALVITVIGVLLLLNAFFVAAEFAIVKVRSTQLDALIDAERQELERLIRVGRDVETGQRFASPDTLFETYLARNVPSEEEALLAYVEGEPYLAALARFPVDRVPAQMGQRWRALSSLSAGRSEDASGRFATSLGEARFRASRIVFRRISGGIVCEN